MTHAPGCAGVSPQSTAQRPGWFRLRLPAHAHAGSSREGSGGPVLVTLGGLGCVPGSGEAAMKAPVSGSPSFQEAWAVFDSGFEYWHGQPWRTLEEGTCVFPLPLQQRSEKYFGKLVCRQLHRTRTHGSQVSQMQADYGTALCSRGWVWPTGPPAWLPGGAPCEVGGRAVLRAPRQRSSPCGWRLHVPGPCEFSRGTGGRPHGEGIPVGVPAGPGQVSLTWRGTVQSPPAFLTGLCCGVPSLLSRWRQVPPVFCGWIVGLLSR